MRHTQRKREITDTETSETGGEMETDQDSQPRRPRESLPETAGTETAGETEAADVGTQGPRGARRDSAGRGGTGAYLRAAAGRGGRRLSPLPPGLRSTAAQGPGGDSSRPPIPAASRSPAPAGPAPINPSWVAPLNP